MFDRTVRRPTSNKERIASFTDLELAIFLTKAHDHEVYVPFCKNSQECCTLLDQGVIPESMCLDCMMDWMNKPTGEDLTWVGEEADKYIRRKENQ